MLEISDQNGVGGLPLTIANLNKHFDQISVLHDFSLSVAAGEFVSVVGPSGSGKSTLFNLLAGLEKPDSGTISIAGKPWQSGKPFGYMPQRDSLLVWRNALSNAALGLEIQGVAKKVAAQQASQYFAEFGLQGFENRYPFQLSGGMRQRVALLRTALTRRPILLLDEPFGALDAITRAELHQWLLNLHAGLRRTVIFVTHDVEEAIFLSDRVIVLSPRPATIKLDLAVTLPRPRLPEMITSPELISLKARLLAVLHQEKQNAQL